MKKNPLTPILVLSVAFILLSAIVPVNPSSQPQPQRGYSLVADGVPLPPPGPRPAINSLIDGVPLPPPGPRPSVANLIDGVPLPPPGPRPNSVSTMAVAG